MHGQRPTGERGVDEGRHDRGVGVAGGLERAEHVEEPEGQRREPELAAQASAYASVASLLAA